MRAHNLSQRRKRLECQPLGAPLAVGGRIEARFELRERRNATLGPSEVSAHARARAHFARANWRAGWPHLLHSRALQPVTALFGFRTAARAAGLWVAVLVVTAALHPVATRGARQICWCPRAAGTAAAGGVDGRRCGCRCRGYDFHFVFSARRSLAAEKAAVS